MQQRVERRHARSGRSLRIVALGLVLAVVTAACGDDDTGGGDDAGSGDGRTVRIVVQEEPPGIDAGSVGPAQGRVNRNMLEALVDVDPESGDLVPLLATSWEQVDDRTWEFTLRDGVTFHNGEPFTADAVVTALARLYGPGEPFVAAEVIPTLTATAVDDLTVSIADEEPNPILPRQMFFVPIMEPGATGDSRNVRDPIGTGPYAFVSYDAESIEMERYDDYWGDAPAVERLEYQWRSESSVRAQMVANGEADIATDLAPQDFGDLRIVDGLGETAAFRPDTSCPYFERLDVRLAIDSAIDRETIAATIFGGSAEPASQLVPPGVIGHSDELEVPEYDLDAARSVVDAARAEDGWGDQPVEILYRPGYFLGAEELAQVYGQVLEDLGFSVALRSMEQDPWLDAFLLKPAPEGRCAVVETSHGNEFRDASYTADLYYAGAGALTLNADADFDRDYATAKALTEEEGRADALADLIRYEAENMANLTAVVHMQRSYGVADGIEWTPRPDAAILGADIR